MKTFMKILTFLLFLVISCMLFAFYVTYVERHLIRTKNITVDISDYKGEPITVAQFTDTQLGEYYTLDMFERAVDEINKSNPDIVVFTGDLIDNASKYPDKFKVSDVLAKIDAKVGKYAIFGNHDYGGGASKFYRKIMTDGGFTVLKNENETVSVNGESLTLIGADDSLIGELDVEKTMDGVNDSSINILLTHEPDSVDDFATYPVDLGLAGHSHGGQVYIPFYGPIVKNAMSKNYSKGKYILENSYKTLFYVNSGLGNTKVPFRFMNIPEITLFTIE